MHPPGPLGHLELLYWLSQENSKTVRQHSDIVQHSPGITFQIRLDYIVLPLLSVHLCVFVCVCVCVCGQMVGGLFVMYD